VGSFGLVLINFLYKKKISKDKLISGNIAVMSGLILFFSILSDWVVTGDQIITGPDIETLFPQTPIIGTSFNFLFVFATLIILGGILHLCDYRIGKKLVYFSGILSIIFSVFFIFIFSNYSMVRPDKMAFVTLLFSIISLVSISINKSLQSGSERLHSKDVEHLPDPATEVASPMTDPNTRKAIGYSNQNEPNDET